ncbi:MAG: GNAT family N-acetyltransferase, partial [Actinobacteria bacterium]|nr:GNAT family N-acetyltransferase [Actinomycetota bacterium]
PRMLEVGDVMFTTGYVEGVATHPTFRMRGLGNAVVSAATAHIEANYQFGALGTSSFSLYQRVGWERWSGSTFVRRAGGREATPDEDGYVMVLRFGPSRDVDTTADLSCDDRPGDVW